MASPKPRSFMSGSPLAADRLSSSPFNPPALPNIPLRSSNPPTPNDSGVQSVVDGQRKPIDQQASSTLASNLSASLRQQQQLQQPQVPLSLGKEAQPPVPFRPSPSPGHLSPNPAARSPNGVSPAGSSSAIDPFSTAFTLETATEEEKANILRRHLVSAQERRQSNATQNQRPEPGTLTRNSSSFALGGNESGISTGSNADRREGPGEDGEDFQLPYNHAGGDVTYVGYFLSSVCLCACFLVFESYPYALNRWLAVARFDPSSLQSLRIDENK